MGDAKFYREQRDRCASLADASKVPAVTARLRALAMRYHIKSAEAPDAVEARQNLQQDLKQEPRKESPQQSIRESRVVRPPESAFGRKLEKLG